MKTSSTHRLPLLEARELTLSWDGEHKIAEELSLTVDASELVALVGRSGTGKTSLLHALAGLTKPLSGKVFVEGKDVTGKPGQLGYMLQKDLLLPSERVIDNVCLPLTLAGVSREEARSQARPLLERFGLGASENSWPHELSGGMRQRAAFLRTYLTGAKLMLLDEPFSALDAITRKELRSWFVEVARELELSALIITHDVDEALTLGDRVLVLVGNPSEGDPSKLGGEVQLNPAIKNKEHFELSSAYAKAKRQLLELL